MKKKYLLFLLEWALRINVFIKLIIYGTGKILGGQFYLKDSIPIEIGAIPLNETGSYNLAWTFFGHSKGYMLFIGISQIMGAFLFLFNRTKLIGASILIPILLNIIVVDYFYGVAYGAMFSACFYLASVLFVVFLHRQNMTKAIRNLLMNSGIKFKGKKLILTTAFVAVLFGLVFFLELFFIGVFGYEDR